MMLGFGSACMNKQKLEQRSYVLVGRVGNQNIEFGFLHIHVSNDKKHRIGCLSTE